MIEMIFRQGLLQQPISIDDLADGASWNGLGRRALLVVRIEGSSRQPVRLVWYASRPATLSPYADVAEAFAHHASLAFRVITERDNSNRAVAARRRVGLAQGTLMTRQTAHGRPGVHPAEMPLPEHPHQAKNDRSNRHPDRRSAGLPRRLRTDDTAPMSAKPGEARRHLFHLGHHADDDERAPRRLTRRPLQLRVCSGSGPRTSHLRFRSPT